MTTQAVHDILVCGTSLLLSAVANYLALLPGADVRLAPSGLAAEDAGFSPDIIVMEKERDGSGSVPGAALALLAEGEDRRVLLLDLEHSTLVVLSRQKMPVSSLSDVAARIEEARR